MIPARAREVFDVSGAGDTVIATLAAGLALGLSFARAAQLSNLAAGIVVGKLGTQPISRPELSAAIALNDMQPQSTGASKIAAWSLPGSWSNPGKAPARKWYLPMDAMIFFIRAIFIFCISPEIWEIA
jgi:D-beta-D-heptose 7-phosphate kinase / D-beta-D-heptose 1-phosphate adenosyltransferase